MDNINTPGIFDRLDISDHESLFFCRDRDTGLRALVGIHNTILGPAMGGLRMYPYESETEALEDVLRLSEAMTYKSALAGIHVGGGKAVIIGHPQKDKSEALLRRFGLFLNQLGGKYYVASDVGIKPEDLETIKLETPFVVGTDPLLGGSGDSSPLTAYGVYLGMKAGIKHMEGHDSLRGKRIMIQGLGKVGVKLLAYLKAEGAELLGFDVNEEALKKAGKEFGLVAVEEEQVLRTAVDILAPCALGGILHPEIIPQLSCKMIAGGANNQLLDEDRDALLLHEKGITYLPDFMVNAGGIINVSLELGSYHESIAKRMTEKIYPTTLEVLGEASEKGTSPLIAAKAKAEKRLSEIGKNRLYR